MFDLEKRLHPSNPDWSKTPRCGSYTAIKCSAHPRAWKNGYLYLHRIVAEMKLGRFLLETEIVHHDDEDGRNNSPDNLIVKVDQSTHAREHRPPRQYFEAVCAFCLTTFLRAKNQDARLKGCVKNFCSRSCNGRFYHPKRVPVTQLDRVASS